VAEQSDLVGAFTTDDGHEVQVGDEHGVKEAAVRREHQNGGFRIEIACDCYPMVACRKEDTSTKKGGDRKKGSSEKETNEMFDTYFMIPRENPSWFKYGQGQSLVSLGRTPLEMIIY